MKQSDGSFIYALRPFTIGEYDDNSLIDIGKNKQGRLIRAETRGIVVIRNGLDDDSNSCEVIYVSRTDFKGNIPAKIMNKTVTRTLHPMFLAREKFNRDDEIDKVEREELMEIKEKFLVGELLSVAMRGGGHKGVLGTILSYV